MRLFLALNLPDETRQAAHEAAAPLRDVAPAIAWVREPQLHVTLKFLGEVGDDRVAALRDATARVAERHRAIDLELAGIGAFPGFRRPRVVWLGVEREPRLELLHHDVEVACEAIGFELEGRPYHPHVTLGRVKERLPDETLRALQRAARGVDFTAPLRLASLDLMRSEPGPGGSRYTLVAGAALRSG